MRDYDTKAKPEFIEVTRDQIFEFLAYHEDRPDVLSLGDLGDFRMWIDAALAAAEAPDHKPWNAIVEDGMRCCERIAAAKCKATTTMSGGFREERRSELLDEFRYVIRTFELRIFMQGIPAFQEKAVDASETAEVRYALETFFRLVRERREWSKGNAKVLTSFLRRFSQRRNQAGKAAERLLLALKRIERMCDKPKEAPVKTDGMRQFSVREIEFTEAQFV